MIVSYRKHRSSTIVIINKTAIMTFKAIMILFLTTAPLCTIAQKAYETATYSGKIKGQAITFKLANGYIGASEIRLQSSTKAKLMLYTPASGAPDSDNTMRFKSDKTTSDYFIVKNMQEAYDQLPVILYAIFIAGHQSFPVKLTLDRNKI